MQTMLNLVVQLVPIVINRNTSKNLFNFFMFRIIGIRSFGVILDSLKIICKESIL
jgi:hypothetical protein